MTDGREGEGLRECPLCECREIAVGHIRDGRAVRCCGCGAGVDAYSPNAEQKARDLWNTRPSGWRDIASAPRDGTEILLFAPEVGVPILARWISLRDFLTETEIDQMISETGPMTEDDLDRPDWHYADFVHGGLLTDGEPTHWQPLPPTPQGEGK